MLTRKKRSGNEYCHKKSNLDCMFPVTKKLEENGTTKSFKNRPVKNHNHMKPLRKPPRTRGSPSGRTHKTRGQVYPINVVDTG